MSINRSLSPAEIELVDFLCAHALKPLDYYQGKYHHLGIDYRSLLADIKGMPDAIVSALSGVNIEEQRDFTAQVLHAILKQGDALERLFKAAFGETQPDRTIGSGYGISH